VQPAAYRLPPAACRLPPAACRLRPDATPEKIDEEGKLRPQGQIEPGCTQKTNLARPELGIPFLPSPLPPCSLPLLLNNVGISQSFLPVLYRQVSHYTFCNGKCQHGTFFRKQTILS